MNSFSCFFIVVVELLIERLTLTKTHKLNVSHQEFYLVISDFEDRIEFSIGFCKAHLHQVNESKIV